MLKIDPDRIHSPVVVADPPQEGWLLSTGDTVKVLIDERTHKAMHIVDPWHPNMGMEGMLVRIGLSCVFVKTDFCVVILSKSAIVELNGKPFKYNPYMRPLRGRHSSVTNIDDSWE
jgi:hypothetical protein